MSAAYAVILVYSTSHALKLEKILQKTGVASKLIPVPRHLSSDCGVCVRIAQSDRDRAESLVQSLRIETQGLFDI